MMRRNLYACSALACSVGCLQGGCSPAANRSTTLAGLPAAEAIIPPAGRSDIAAASTGAPSSRASRGASRDGWERTVFIAPAGEVSHRPTYARIPTSYSEHKNPRRDGEFPTAESSLTAEGDSGAETMQAIAAPFWAAADIIRFPIAAILTPPWTVTTGRASYERMPTEADPTTPR